MHVHPGTRVGSVEKQTAAAAMSAGRQTCASCHAGKRIMPAILFCAWQLVLHSVQGWKSDDPGVWMLHLVAWVHDILIIGGILTAGEALIYLAPEKIRPAVKIFSYTVLLCCGATLSIYPQMLREYAGLSINIFSIDSATAWTTLTGYLGVGNIWPVGMVVMAGIAPYAMPVMVRPGLRSRHLSIGIIFLLTIAAVATLPRSPHPLIASINLQFAELRSERHRVVPSLQHLSSRKIAGAPQKNQTSVIDARSAVDHLFLIVLEGVTAQDFEGEFMPSPNGFYRRVQKRASWFSNYHATNLDSYTSLIAMLTGEQVPFRSYTDVSLYDHVNKTDNLTRSLRSQEYSTLFISTYAEQPFVPTRNDWHGIMDRNDLGSLDGWVSLGSARMEQATEDRAALNTIIQTASNNSRTFILHELVYGHSTEWQVRTGKSQLAYYDAYLNELLDRLEAKGLDSRSLLVIVSDHGNRAKAADAENYRVPLLVVGNNLPSPPSDDKFRSHLDLWAIIASFMNGTALPPARKEMFVVGSTARWIYGKITADKQNLFIDDINGTRLAACGRLSAATVNQGFQALLDSFRDRFVR